MTLKTTEEFEALPLIEKAILIAEKIVGFITAKNEPTELLAFYNNMLQKHSHELVS